MVAMCGRLRVFTQHVWTLSTHLDSYAFPLTNRFNRVIRCLSFTFLYIRQHTTHIIAYAQPDGILSYEYLVLVCLMCVCLCLCDGYAVSPSITKAIVSHSLRLECGRSAVAGIFHTISSGIMIRKRYTFHSGPRR